MCVSNLVVSHTHEHQMLTIMIQKAHVSRMKKTAASNKKTLNKNIHDEVTKLEYKMKTNCLNKTEQSRDNEEINKITDLSKKI